MPKIRVLFVCLGNICRSPTAEGVFRKKVEQLGLQDVVDIDSAGTAAWHIGKSPDPRTIRAAAERGYDLSPLRARQAQTQDFVDFDYVLAMDQSNYDDLLDLRRADCSAKLDLFLNYADGQDEIEVPDPYYGGADGFRRVLDLIEDASDGLLKSLRENGEI